MIARLLQHGIEHRFAQNHPRESHPTGAQEARSTENVETRKSNSGEMPL